MTLFLTFQSCLFFGGLGILLTVAFIEHVRAWSHQPTELTHEKRLQKAA